jgi:cell wall-associated NlpC family hydrolase
LLDAANALSRREEIPYVWGGRTTSSPVVCAACKRCIEKRKLNPYQRKASCPACEQCGLDCSGFVSRVMSAAGLQTGRVTSQSLGSRKSKVFKPVGRDLVHARPGDLVVLKDHVVIFLRRHGPDKFDYIHASRFIPGRKTGGIEVVSSSALPRRLRPIVILRHESLFGVGYTPAVRSRINALITSHQEDPVRLARAN